MSRLDYKGSTPVNPSTANPFTPSASGCYVALGKQTSDGTTNLFDFQGISQSYSDLRVRIMGAIDIGSGGTGTCYLQVNNDSSASYRGLHVSWIDNTTTITQVTGDIGFDLPGPTFSGGSYPVAGSIVEVLIAEYTTTSFWKSMQALGHEMSTNASGTLAVARGSFRSRQYQSTDPITSVQVGTITALGGGGGGEVFVAGTTCTLHGIC